METLEKTVTEAWHKYTAACTLCQTEKKRLKASRRKYKHSIEAQRIAQGIAQTIQQKAHTQLTSVVTYCLQAIFGKEYAFKINFEQKRGKTEAYLRLVKNGHELADPLEEDSGGVCDTAAFALRLSCLLMSKPALRKILILDEPFKSVSTEFREGIRQLIETLAKDFGVQIIMVTHEAEYRCGKIIQL